MKLNLIALVLCVTNCARAEVSRVLWEEVTQLLWKVDDLFFRLVYVNFVRIWPVLMVGLLCVLDCCENVS